MSMFGANSPSLADIAAVTDRNNNDGMMGMNGMGGWWVLIILLALFGGFGNGGWGNRSNNSENGGTTIVTVPTSGGFGGNSWGPFDAASMQRGFDNSQVISKLDNVFYGISNLGYDQLAQMNGIGNTVQQTGWGITQQMQNGQVANMQSFNALQALIQSCCCENRQGQMEIINAMDKNACQTNWNMAQLAQQTMQNDNANFRSLEKRIDAGFDALREQGYIQEIQGLRQQLNDCNMRGIAQATADQVVARIAPPPVPSFDVPAPYPFVGNGSRCCR